MKKIVLVFGLLAGFVMLAVQLVTMSLGSHSMLLGYTVIVAASLLIYFGVRAYRDNVAGGSVTFGRALAVGALIALVQALCYTAAWEVYYFTAHPDYIAQYQARELDEMRREGATPAAIDAKVAEQRKMAEMYEKPIFNAGMTMMEPLPVGLLLALASAGLLSRRRTGAGAAAVSVT
jgi:hypothetical protein